MQAYLTLTRRELAGFFLSLTGYVIIAAAAGMNGLSLVVMLVNLQGEPTTVPITELFFQTAFFWIILLAVVPLITMRLIALEKFSGTFETLMTTPVKDVQVVAAKFTASVTFYSLIWVPLLGCILVLHRLMPDAPPLDPGVLASGFLGILLLGCPFLAFGLLASSITRSQLAAAMMALVFSLSLFFLSFLPSHSATSDWKSQVAGCFALRDHVQDFVRGVVDTRPIVLYITLTFFFLFLTLRVLGSRRWK